uniref:Uncharacterized protein n=1 Tax=Oryza brachyantha TaxID=4533 RepID=J3MP90_ORYBR
GQHTHSSLCLPDPIFAATEKRYYPYSLWVPVDPNLADLFHCKFQKRSPIPIIHLYQLWLKLHGT